VCEKLRIYKYILKTVIYQETTTNNGNKNGVLSRIMVMLFEKSLGSSVTRHGLLYRQQNQVQQGREQDSTSHSTGIYKDKSLKTGHKVHVSISEKNKVR
jgi:hypothetical protein